MVMALEAKIPVSGIQRLILQATRGSKERKHWKKRATDIACKCSFPGKQFWSWKSPCPCWPWALESRGGGDPHIQHSSTRLNYPCLCFTATLGDTGRCTSQKWCDLEDHKILGNPNWTQPHCAHRQSYKLWEINQNPSALHSAQVSALSKTLSKLSSQS